jgi:hypothetical protein
MPRDAPRALDVIRAIHLWGSQRKSAYSCLEDALRGGRTQGGMWKTVSRGVVPTGLSLKAVIDLSGSSFRPVQDPVQPLSSAPDMLPHRLAGGLLVMCLDGRCDCEVLVEGRGLGPL